MNAVCFREIDWESPAVQLETRDNGEILLSSAIAPDTVPQHVIEMLQNAARIYPRRVFLAERDDSDEWVELTYEAADRRTECIAQWLIDSGLTSVTPVMILSENTIENALLMLAAFKAGLTVVPVSPGYSLYSHDHAKLKKIFDKTQPGLVFVQNTKPYNQAIAALDLKDCAVVAVNDSVGISGAVIFSTLEQTVPTAAVKESITALNAETLGKILFTSGSTGEPKGVVNTHGNMCFPHAALSAIFHIDSDNNPTIMLDWLPWHHTYGGNQNINRTLFYAGTLYIDAGKPLPHLIDITLKNLREIAVTAYSTVPAAYSVLLDALEKDAPLRKTFFSKLEWLSYGGADMPQSLYDRIQVLAIAETGKKIPVTTALGSTESNSIITAVHWENEHMGNIGLPVPGTTLKLVPIQDKLEMRVKGPQMTSCYFKDEQKTRDAFDDEGYFRTGDALRWIDPDDPLKGLCFAGRVAEDFKLLNGTWVHTGSLRTKLQSAMTPVMQDVVIAGQDQHCVGALMWLVEANVRELVRDQETAWETLLQREDVRALVIDRVANYNAQNNHASTAIRRVILLAEAPSLDSGEITDKRYINQSAVLALRVDEVSRLYQTPCSEKVIDL